MQTMVKATFTIMDDSEKAKRTEVIEMVYPMNEDGNFLKSLIEYLVVPISLFKLIWEDTPKVMH